VVIPLLYYTLMNLSRPPLAESAEELA
jgi:hypothetical protein